MAAGLALKAAGRCSAAVQAAERALPLVVHAAGVAEAVDAAHVVLDHVQRAREAFDEAVTAVVSAEMPAEAREAAERALDALEEAIGAALDAVERAIGVGDAGPAVNAAGGRA